MALNAKGIGEAIALKRAALGLSQEELADQVGSTQSTIGRIEAGQFKRLPDALPKIASRLDLDLAPFGIDVPSPRLANGYRPPPRIMGHRDLPVYGTAEGGSGSLILSHDPVEYAERPYMLDGIQNAYGIVVEGKSMIPRFYPGDVAWVNPRLPPARGAEVILYSVTESGGEERAMVKELVAFDDRAWTVKQWNPKKTFRLPRAEWQTCHRVVGNLFRR